ncbi:TetR/AcrR family transcriptional regulator [Ancylobacter oerskovii]|uniref:TetR/AcrR family transcriptional regulator n=1 Tax=Ancylobacter oerskovii TaxID=459519 RepID=A0ABW4YUY9_9HYPH|nr:TetR/AcrR family transcriptional regulator [Ancylobacter oerskovii]MBS7544513.1 TetR/AcrR family transcriptional regulator [Ancylobacter oerskovii]
MQASVTLPFAWAFPSPGASKRRQILDGAAGVFLACGFDGASMGEIARAAGVSKGTLYTYFPSKEELFRALLREKCSGTAERCFLLAPDGEVRAELTAVARRYIAAMAEPEYIATLRVVIGVADKFPAIGAAYHEAGIETAVALLRDWLAGKAARGELAMEAPELAARQFICSCYAQTVTPMLFGQMDAPAPEEVDRAIRFTVDAFLRAFGPAAERDQPAAPSLAPSPCANSVASPSR